MSPDRLEQRKQPREEPMRSYESAFLVAQDHETTSAVDGPLSSHTFESGAFQLATELDSSLAASRVSVARMLPNFVHYLPTCLLRLPLVSERGNSLFHVPLGR